MKTAGLSLSYLCSMLVHGRVEEGSVARVELHMALGLRVHALHSTWHRLGL